MAIRAKVFEFAAGIDPDGRLTAGEGAEPVTAGDGWTPEHLVLAAVSRCSLSSLKYYAQRAKVAVTGSGRARGTVTAREEDGRYAFVEIEIDLDVSLDPAPAADEVAKLLRRAQDGCFVGNSLQAKPTYRWTVNGRAAAA